jgi:FkbM family methyltransferase
MPNSEPNASTQGRLVSAVVARLFPFKTLRSVAKRLLRNYTVRQSYHEGVICFNAVDHSWAWTGKVRYETYDRALQDALLDLSRDRDVMIDIGSNVGAMTLSVLLRNPDIEAVCVDPNPIAVRCLRKSVQLNGLSERVTILQAAVSGGGEDIAFDFAESVMGHVSSSGEAVETIPLHALLERFATDRRCLLKIDTEGYESTLIRSLASAAELRDTVLVAELHPLKFNGSGDPAGCVAHLHALGLTVSELDGTPVDTVSETGYSQVVATV